MLRALKSFRVSVCGVRCPAGGFWPIVSRQLDWIPPGFGRGRADDPANCPDRSLQVIRRQLHVCCRAQTSLRLLWEKHWPLFQLWEKLNCHCWQGNRHIRTIPRDICTRMTMWRPSLEVQMVNKKKCWEFCVICFNSINSCYSWTSKKSLVAVRVSYNLSEIIKIFFSGS